MKPAAFIDILTAITGFSLGLSVFLRGKKNSLNSRFFLFTFALSLYFVFSAFKISYGYEPFYAGFLSIMAAAFGGYKFFEHFLPVKPGSKLLKTEYVVTVLVTLAIAYGFAKDVSDRVTVFKTASLVYALFTSALSLSIIQTAKKNTKSVYINKRLTYLFGATLVFTGTLTLSRIFSSGGPFYFAGAIVTLIYLYFVSQILLQHRLMDFGELFVKISFLAGMVILISGIYATLLFWIPERNSDFLFLNIIIASVITLILLDPFEQITQRWIGKLIYRKTRKLDASIKKTEHKLKYIQNSDKELASIVSENLMESGRISGISIYFADTHFTELRLASHTGLPTPETLMTSEFQPVLERLKYQNYITAEEISQDMDRNMRSFGFSPENDDLTPIKKLLEKLNASAVLAIKNSGVLYGIICLSREQSNTPFSYTELALFSEAAAKTGNALVNMERHKKMMEKEHLMALGNMSAGLAHEIRNPLGSIKGAVQVLSDVKERFEEEEAEFFDIIEEETERLNRIVENFLDFARSRNINTSEVDIEDVVNTALKLMPEEKRTFVTIEKHNVNTKISGDKDKLIQVFLNLLLNAAEAVQDVENPFVKVGFNEISGKRLEVRVEDNGIGIEKDDSSRIFMPFVTTKTTGTGMGLAVSKQIIEAHGGEITVKSDKNKGTSFRVVLHEIID